MLDKDSQRFYLEKIESGYFDMQFLSPPCGSWSRANYANDLKPQPCQGRKHPWGFPNLCASQRRRAENGNEFIHFSIHAIVAAQQAKARGFRVMSLWEHPEDLGMTHRGEPASVWQLPEVRTAFGNNRFSSVAIHQCKFGVDRAKPTRLLSDLELSGVGYLGWPSFDAAGYYAGPLPRHCWHNHKEKMIGHTASGAFHTSPTAAYPPEMCRCLADLAYDD